MLDGSWHEQAVIFHTAPGAAQPAVLAVDMVSQSLCIPGTHVLLLQGKDHLLSVDADAAPPVVQHSPAVLPASDQPAALCITPDGAAALVLSCAKLPARSNRHAMLGVYDPVSLACTSTTSWQVPAASGPSADFKGQTVHCSPRACSVAACFEGVGTRVFALEAGKVGRCLFWAAGLEGVSFSPISGAFLAGVRGWSHQVLDAHTGTCLYELPELVFDQAQPPAAAFSIAWSAHEYNQLHACYAWGECDPTWLEQTSFAYSLLKY